VPTYCATVHRTALRNPKPNPDPVLWLLRWKLTHQSH